MTDSAVAEFWEARYADTDRVWSGRVNQTFADIVADLPAGRALDVGCGEGGDTIWLARRGWEVTAVDVSATAITRAAQAAADVGVPTARIRWLARDLSTWDVDGSYDLVSACFFHSPVDIPRADILSRAAHQVDGGGRLLIISHAGPPPWASEHWTDSDHDGCEHRFLTPAEEIGQLDIDLDDWDVQLAETRSRSATGPDGQEAVLDDYVVLLRRR